MPDQTSGQQQDGNPTGDGTGQPPASSGGAANAGITFTPEQQAHIDGLVSDRLRRAQAKWEADAKAGADKAKADADTARLAEEKKFQELADKHAKERDAAIAERDAERATVQRYRLNDAFRREAEVAKLRFTSVQAEQDAFALLDTAEVEVGEDGKVRGMDKALKALQTSRPYLFAKPEQPGSLNAGEGRGGGPPQDDKARQESLRQRFRLG